MTAAEEPGGALEAAAGAVSIPPAPSSGSGGGGGEVAGPHVVAGTFGNRQGLRMMLAGPFTHTYIF